ncbi:MAG TPA: hypothetical protein VFS23_25335 [Vicinamibacterales bacterium]|nr:hypothetical protein [Vicinamibacterales bacterium]
MNYYAALQRMAIAKLGPPLMVSDAEQLIRQQRRFANAMREARPVAHAGDFFTPAVSRYFRARVEAVVWDTGLDVAMLFEAPDEDEVVVTPVLRVWEAVPWNAGPVMWPSMLWALPGLPPDLEYRVSGRHLVLIDVLANLVVDVLHDARPGPESSSS